MLTFEALRSEYAQLWASMVIRSSFKPALEASANKILANKARYQAVSDMTGVPWFVIGLIHQMEAGCNFGCHLHNGDSLARKTKNVPANRPPTGNGPYKWEVSACDALLMKHLDTITDWTIERICYELERYNGWGYRRFHKTTLSPYLWSGTTHYARGKYVADGKWDSTAVSKQSGAIALLKRLMEVDETIKPFVAPVEATPPTPEPTVAESFVKAEEKAPPMALPVKKTLWQTLGLDALWDAVSNLFPGTVPDPPVGVISKVANWQASAESVQGLASSAVIGYVICGMLLYTAICHLGPFLLKKLGVQT